MPRKPKPPHPTHLTIIRYELPDGRRCTKATPGARRRVTRSDTYYADIPGEGRVSLGTTDLGEAWEELRKRLRRQERRRLGISEQEADSAEKAWSQHVEEWIAAVAAGDQGHVPTAKHLDALQADVLALARLAGWERLHDVTRENALAALARLQEPTEGRPAGLSNQTRNHYLAHLKQFILWCHDGGRLAANPVRRLKPLPVETDRRHDRRSPSDEEVLQLFAWLEKGPPEPAHHRGKGGVIKGNARVVRVRNGMDGPHRALGYKVAMATGLRADEVRSLSRRSFDLDQGTVTVHAGYSKRRRKDTVLLPPWLVTELRAHFEAGGRCWQTLPANHPGSALRRDLEDAGVAYATPGPDGTLLYFDYHALRHWYCTQIANQPGISPKTMMELCRHSTPNLTLKLYAKARTQDLRQAVDQIPPPGTPPPPPAKPS